MGFKSKRLELNNWLLWAVAGPRLAPFWRTKSFVSRFNDIQKVETENKTDNTIKI